jgi:hypothetical protein
VSEETIRDQVRAQIMEVIASAEAAGKDGVKAALKAFPGTPRDIVLQCRVLMQVRRNEKWWEQVEQTLDGELVKRAIAGAGEASG